MEKKPPQSQSYRIRQDPNYRQLNVDIEEIDHRKLRTRAAELGVTISDIIRKLIREYL